MVNQDLLDYLQKGDKQEQSDFAEDEFEKKWYFIYVFINKEDNYFSRWTNILNINLII